MRKRAMWILFILVLGSALVVAQGAAKKTSGFVIGLSNFSLGNSWRVQMIEEVKYAVAQRGDLVKQLIITEADNSVEKQIADMEDLISKKVDAILITTASPKGLVPVVEKAMKAGIVVVDFDNLVDTDDLTSHIIVDQKEYGRVLADFLVKAMKGKGDIFVFNGMKGTSASADRYDGAKAVFAKYPGIKVLQEVYADWDYAKAKRAIQTLLAAFPKVDGVWSQGGAMSQAIIEAFMENGLNPPIITGDDSNGFLTT